MNDYSKTSQKFKEHVSILNSKMDLIIGKLAFQYDSEQNKKMDFFLEMDDSFHIYSNIKSLFFDDFNSSKRHVAGVLSSAIVDKNNFYFNRIYHKITVTDFSYSQIQENNLSYKENVFLQKIQVLPNGENLFESIDHFIKFASQFTNEFDFSIQINVNDNCELIDVLICYSDLTNALTYDIPEHNVYIYQVDMFKNLNISGLSGSLSLIELTFCQSVFKDFVDIINSPSHEQIIELFNANKDEYIAIAEMQRI